MGAREELAKIATKGGKAMQRELEQSKLFQEALSRVEEMFKPYEGATPDVPQTVFPRSAPGRQKIDPVVETFHGIDVVDPYRWLEGDNSNPSEAGRVTPEVAAWTTRAAITRRPSGWPGAGGWPS